MKNIAVYPFLVSVRYFSLKKGIETVLLNSELEVLRINNFILVPKKIHLIKIKV